MRTAVENWKTATTFMYICAYDAPNTDKLITTVSVHVCTNDFEKLENWISIAKGVFVLLRPL